MAETVGPKVLCSSHILFQPLSFPIKAKTKKENSKEIHQFLLPRRDYKLLEDTDHVSLIFDP